MDLRSSVEKPMPIEPKKPPLSFVLILLILLSIILIIIKTKKPKFKSKPKS